MTSFGINTTTRHPSDLRLVRIERNQRLTRWLLGLLVLAVVVVGCAKTGVDAWIEPHQTTGNSIAESKAFNSVASGVAASGEKMTRGQPSQLFAFIRDTLAKQLFSLDTAAKSHDEATRAMLQREGELSRKLEASQAAYERLYRSTGAKAERFVRRMFWYLVIYLGVAVGLRIVGQLALGPFGGVASIISTIMLGPLAWLQAGFDNVFFRKLKK
ncbi:MAG: hypothetical protein IT560_14300 [Alphaproteobacteria bacterium]|nr:hypothetical protein [Alphaproteobacteria bacterium]